MISYGYEREQDRLRQVRAAHLPEVLQRRRDLLQLRPTASQAAEPRSQRQGYGHHGQRLHLRCREQRAQRSERCISTAERQGRRADGTHLHLRQPLPSSHGHRHLHGSRRQERRLHTCDGL